MKQLFILILSTCISVLAVAQPPKVSAEKGSAFGEKISTENAISVKKMVSLMNAKPDGSKTMQVTLKVLLLMFALWKVAG